MTQSHNVDKVSKVLTVNSLSNEGVVPWSARSMTVEPEPIP